MVEDLLNALYPWVKALHVVSVIAWMAGLLYLPRLMVYHVENVQNGNEMDATFQVMEGRLFRLIMTPAMVAAWLFGILLALTPYVINWQHAWPWVKLVSVLLMTGFHHWLGARCKDFMRGQNTISGRQYRLANEVPTALMIVIVVSVIVKY